MAKFWSAIPAAVSRSLALAAIALVVYGPIAGFLGLDRMPLLLRALWVVAVAAAARWPRYSLIAFLAGTPLLATLPTIERWPSVSLGELWLFALLLPAWARVVLGKRGAATGVRLPMAATLLLVVSTCSLLVIYYRSPFAGDGAWLAMISDAGQFLRTEYVTTTAQRHYYASIISWATLAEGVATLWLMLTVFSRERDGEHARAGINQALMAMGIGAVAAAAVGTYQWWTGDSLLTFWRVNDPGITRINATFSDVNAAGAYFAFMLMPVWTIARLRQEPRWHWGWRLGAGLVVLALVFTASRSSWLAAMAATATFWWLSLRLHDTDAAQAAGQRRRMIAVLALVTAVLMAGSAYATVRDIRHKDQHSYLDTALYTLNLRVPMNERLKNRAPFWRAAVQMFDSRPITGVGIGRYYKLMPKYLEDEGVDVIQENAHNYLLQTGAELGLLGVGCFLALLGSGLWAGWRVATQKADALVRAQAAALTGGMIALLVTCLAAHVLLLREGQLTFWPIVGLALLLDWQTTAAVVRRETLTATGPATGPAGESIGRWRAPVLAATIVLLLAAVPIRAARELAQVDLSRMTQGLYDEEKNRDGTRYRWTGARATIYVPSDAVTLTLPIRTIAPMPQAVTILRDGHPVDQITLSDHAWHEPRYVLSGLKSDERFHRFDIQVSPTWHPPSDARELGVMIGAYRWSR